MALRVYLNNELLEISQHSSLAEAPIVLRRSENNYNATSGNSSSPAFGFSQEILFYGKSALSIFQELVEPLDARIRSINCDIFDDCCDILIFKGKILAENIEVSGIRMISFYKLIPISERNSLMIQEIDFIRIDINQSLKHQFFKKYFLMHLHQCKK